MSELALVVGATGQDGVYLTQRLLSGGYSVLASSRRQQDKLPASLQDCANSKLKMVTLDPEDRDAVISLMREFPISRVFFLSAQSSVGRSFEVPLETIDSVVGPVAVMLEAIRSQRPKARFLHASSSEMFGSTEEIIADEDTKLAPLSPYAAAKAAAHFIVDSYRQSFGLFCANAVMFNHESSLRPSHFVVQKIVRGALSIARGRQEKLVLGNLSVIRDWGWAPEYCDAMARILEQDAPENFIICTGQSYSLEQVVECAFSHFGLDWRRSVESSAQLMRRSDLKISRGNPARALERLGWSATKDMPRVVESLLEALISEEVLE